MELLLKHHQFLIARVFANQQKNYLLASDLLAQFIK